MNNSKKALFHRYKMCFLLTVVYNCNVMFVTCNVDCAPPSFVNGSEC